MDSFATRIYVQLLPHDATRNYLRTVTQQLSEHVQGRAIDEDRWHVTILHFGVAEHVFHDIKRDYPALSRTTFDEALHNYIATSKSHLPAGMTLSTDQLELFGINENVLVLKLHASPEIVTAHEVALNDLTVFLEACGVHDTQSFMQGSINFRWALEVTPHVTLFRAVRDARLDMLELEPAELSFLPGDLHGIDGR